MLPSEEGSRALAEVRTCDASFVTDSAPLVDGGYTAQ